MQGWSLNSDVLLILLAVASVLALVLFVVLINDRKRLNSQVDTEVKLSDLTHQLVTEQATVNHLKGVEKQLMDRQQAYECLFGEHEALKARSQAEQHALKEQLKLLLDAKKQLTNEFEVLANRIFDDKQKKFSEQSKAIINTNVEPLREQLQSFRKKVEDVYEKESADRNMLVGKITELQKQTEQIGNDAIRLTSALKGDNKAQGNWGEVVLERLLEESGLHKGREYNVQVSLKDEEGRRRNPDVVVHLPEGKDIVIDSKMSLVHYEQYCSEQDDAVKEVLLKQHIQSVRTHIQQLSVKSYEKLEGVRTLDFVFIFMPVEGAFMLALQNDPSLFRDAYERQIILVSPTTLLATLRTVENIWRYEKQNRNAEKIAKEAGGLYDQFVLLLESIGEADKHLGKATEAYEKATKQLGTGRGNLLRRVENLRVLGAKSKKKIPQTKLDNADPLLDSEPVEVEKVETERAEIKIKKPETERLESPSETISDE